MTPPQTPQTSAEDELLLVDKRAVAGARDILGCMANAVSAMKIYPSDHATVRNFVDALAQKFEDHFRTYQRLQVGVEEYSFTCAGQVVYTDEMTIKSLPFFFFKDGTQTLIFYRGLDRKEVLAFLELIRNVAQKPGGDNDIVAALWESDFSNIQYHAPDEFVENRILAEKQEALAEERDLPELPSDLAHETLEIKVDLAKFSEGRIELKVEDRDKFSWGLPGDEGAPAAPPGSPQSRAAEQPETSPDGSSGLAVSPAASLDPNLRENELEELESMIRANRQIKPEEEFLDLVAEVLYLESDLSICAESLDVLIDFQLGQIAQGNFSAAVAAIRKIDGLRPHLGLEAGRKTEILDITLKKMTGPRAIEAVVNLLETPVPIDWEALLDFFRLLGPQTLSTAAGLFESRSDPDVRARFRAFIEEAGAQDPGLLAGLANDARPALSLEIIGMLSKIAGQKGIPHLSAFLMFKDRALKLEVIHVLGQSPGESANRILMGFLNDAAEDLRIQAAMKLNPSEERSRLVHLIQEASLPPFRKKSLKEKRAILSFLGRTRSEEALEFLAATLRKTRILPSARRLEMRLAAVTGLESMGTPEAAEALEAATRARGRKLREASSEALARLHTANPAGSKRSPS
jgi:HEAT repeat protein